MNSSDINKSYSWILHVLAWTAIAVIPLFGTRPDVPMVSNVQYLHFLVTEVSLMVVFYVNYFFLIKKFLFRKKLVLFFLLNAVLIATIIVFIHFISFRLLPPPPSFGRPDRGPIHHGPDLGNIFINVLVIAASVAIKTTSQVYNNEATIKEIEKSRTEAELQNLKSQLNPHFLFNTLNNIYSLVQFDTDKAQEAILDLSKALRYVLYDTGSNRVSVKADMDFIKEYIALMKMRLPVGTTLTVSLPEEGSEIYGKQIAPLLFISIIENAFKHGTSGDEDSFIDIDIHEHKEDNNVSLVCQVRNTNNPKTSQDRSGSGVGLENLRKRLELLYPDRHSFVYGVKGDVYESVLTVRLD